MFRRLQVCYLALSYAVLVTDTHAIPDLPPALKYPQLPKRFQDSSYQSAALVGQQPTQPTFHDLTHQSPHPSWLDLPSSPSSPQASPQQSNIQQIPVKNRGVSQNRRLNKPPSQQYPQQSTQFSQSGYQQSDNQSVRFVDIPTNNLPIHREEVEYSPYQTNDRSNVPDSSGRSQTSSVTSRSFATPSTPLYTLPQVINSNDPYSNSESRRNFNGASNSGYSPPNQSFDTSSIKVVPSVYQQPPFSSDQSASQYGSSTTSSNSFSSTSSPVFNQGYPGSSRQNQPNYNLPASSEQSGRNFGSTSTEANSPSSFSGQGLNGSNGRFGGVTDSISNRLGDQTGSSYPKSNGQTTISSQSYPSNSFGNQPSSYPSNSFGNQPSSYPSKSLGNQPSSYPSKTFGNQPSSYPSKTFGNQPSSYPANSAVGHPVAYQPAFAGSPPAILVPSTPSPLGITPIYYVSSSPAVFQTTPSPGVFGPVSQTPNTFSVKTTASPYPQGSFVSQSPAYPPIPNSRNSQSSNRGSSGYSQPQSAVSTTAKPIVSRGQVTYPTSSYGDLSAGYGNSVNPAPNSQPINRGQVKYTTQNPYETQSENYPQNSPANRGNSAVYPQANSGQSSGYPNRGQVKFASNDGSSGQYPGSSNNGRSWNPQTSNQGIQGNYPRSSSTVPAQTYGVTTTVAPAQNYPQRQNNGRSNSQSSRSGLSQGYPSPAIQPFPQAAYPSSPTGGQSSWNPQASNPGLQPSNDRSDTYPRPSSTVSPQTYAGSTPVAPGQNYPQNSNSGRVNSQSSRAGIPRGYPAPTSPPFSQSGYSQGGVSPSSAPGFVSSSPPSFQSAVPSQPSEPSYPQPGPPYQQAPSIAAQYNPNSPKSQTPNTLSYPPSSQYPPASYAINQVYGPPASGSNSVSGASSGSSTAAPSIYDYQNNPFLKQFVPGSSASGVLGQPGYAPRFPQANPGIGPSITSQRRSDVGQSQGSTTLSPSYGGSSSSTSGQSASVSCPERTGRFADPVQCDAYVECIEGVGEQKQCPDGLLFNPKAYFTYPCGYPAEVDCGARSGLQPAQSTADCPHQFGYYRLGDQTQCSQYMNCANGVGYLQTCPEGLAFNELTIRCDWPDEVPSCDAESFLGFTCPQPSGNQDGDKPPNFPHPTEPTKYFSCQNGRPRLHSCPGPFDPSTSLCQGVENEEQSQNNYNSGDGSSLSFAPQPGRTGY